MAEPGLLGKIADLVPDVMLLVRLDGAILDFNQAAGRLVPGMRVGASLLDVVVDLPESVRHSLDLWAHTGEPVLGALSFKGHDGPLRCRCRGGRVTWLPAVLGRDAAGAVVQLHCARAGAQRSALIRDKFAALSREVSYRQQAAAQHERLLAAEQSMRERTQRLYRLSTALASSSTLGEVAHVVRTEVAASLGGITAELGLFPDQVLPSFRVPRRRKETEAWHDLDADPASVLATAARAGGPTLITDPARPLAAVSPRAAEQDHIAYCVPLELQGRRFGLLAVALPPAEPTLTPPEQEHAYSVVAQIAQAVARARLFEHEHHLAERLQRSLLPTLPRLPHLTVATRYLPSTESLRVGGDWYDLFELGPGQVGLAIGDVAGHSLAEATVMAQLQNALRAIALEYRAPGETMKRLNDFTLALLPTTMATACYLTLDIQAGWLSFTSAGHLPPLLTPADGLSRFLDDAHGPALGADPEASYPEVAVRLAEGDTLLLYTDGLIEQRGESLDTGLARLLATMRQAAGLDPEALCDLVIRDQPGAHRRDDRALLALRFEHSAAARARAGAPARPGARPEPDDVPPMSAAPARTAPSGPGRRRRGGLTRLPPPSAGCARPP